jgi:hypothetical protein
MTARNTPMDAVLSGRLLWQQRAETLYLEPAIVGHHPWLRCAFSTRHASSQQQAFNLSFDRGERPVVLANRQHLLRAMGLTQATLSTVRQVHGNRVCVVDAEMLARGLAGVAADALVTALPHTALGVLIADCLPIILYTHYTPVVAVVHAGRMGTYEQIVTNVLAVMQQRFAVAPAQVHAILGPAIGACCYTLDDRAVEPLQQRFSAWQTFIYPCRTATEDDRAWTMSLQAANTAQLCAAGVPAQHIEDLSPCTFCYNEHLFSHRAEGPGAGRGMAVAVLQYAG